MTQQIYILDSFETDYKIFVNAANTEQEFIVNFQYSSGATFIANRGKIEITAGRNTWINRYNGVLTDGGLV